MKTTYLYRRLVVLLVIANLACISVSGTALDDDENITDLRSQLHTVADEYLTSMLDYFEEYSKYFNGEVAKGIEPAHIDKFGVWLDANDEYTAAVAHHDKDTNAVADVLAGELQSRLDMIDDIDLLRKYVPIFEQKKAEIDADANSKYTAFHDKYSDQSGDIDYHTWLAEIGGGLVVEIRVRQQEFEEASTKLENMENAPSTHGPGAGPKPSVGAPMPGSSSSAGEGQKSGDSSTTMPSSQGRNAALAIGLLFSIALLALIGMYIKRRRHQGPSYEEVYDENATDLDQIRSQMEIDDMALDMAEISALQASHKREMASKKKGKKKSRRSNDDDAEVNPVSTSESGSGDVPGSVPPALTSLDIRIDAGDGGDSDVVSSDA